MSRILIIDDDKAFCTTISLMLTKLKHEVVVLHSLKNVFRKQDIPSPDLIMLDIEFPDADGIRRLPDVKIAFPNTPIILISNHTEDSYVSRAIKSNTDFILLEQILISILYSLINVCKFFNLACFKKGAM